MNASQLNEALIQGMRQGIASLEAGPPLAPAFAKVFPLCKDLVDEISELEFTAASLESFDVATRRILDSINIGPIELIWFLSARGRVGRDPTPAELDEVLPLLVGE